ncbi:MAG: hypothetical protein Q9M09_02890 [Mariprofundaceae bacterium]|nr:hypothetical protein [Mariprofundaceae bacterium]
MVTDIDGKKFIVEFKASKDPDTKEKHKINKLNDYFIENKNIENISQTSHFFARCYKEGDHVKFRFCHYKDAMLGEPVEFELDEFIDGLLESKAIKNGKIYKIGCDKKDFNIYIDALKKIYAKENASHSDGGVLVIISEDGIKCVPINVFENILELELNQEPETSASSDFVM